MKLKHDNVDVITKDDDRNDGGGGNVHPKDPKTWWEKNKRNVIGIGSILLVVAIIILIAIL